MKIIKLLFFLFFSVHALGQDSVWVEKSFNDILTLGFPANTQSVQQGYVKAYGGIEKDCYLSFNYYDTLIKVESGKDLQIALAGFISGFMTNFPPDKFEMTVTDAAIGGSRGIMIKFIAKDSTASVQQLYCYVTMANAHFYSFHTTLPRVDENDAVSNHFFKLIRFDASRIKENSFEMDTLILR